MFSCFFTPEQQLPPGIGFPLYGPGHLSALICILGLTVMFLLLFRNRGFETQNSFLKVLSVSIPLLELIRDLILEKLGAFTVGYLPLHLCSLSMFVCLYYAWHPNSPIAGHILYSIVLPGALCALLFPNWTKFPLMHFQSIHSFLYHNLLVLFSLTPVVFRRIRPGLSGILPSVLFLLALSVPVGILNLFLNTNYMFLRGPSKGSPLEILARVPGRFGYLLGYLVLVLAVIIIMNLPFTLRDIFQKTRHGRV